MIKYLTALSLSFFMSSAAMAGAVVYGFDGTGQNIKYGQKTNVFHFIDQYKKANEYAKAVYAAGVGANYQGGNFNPLNYAGKMTGVGGRKIVNGMYDELIKHYQNNDKGIVLVGYSRGAALAREFAHIIDERGDPLKYQEGAKPQGKAPTITFMGLFDTVYSFGLAAGKIDRGYHKTIPSNVMAVAHATAGLEKRNLFDLWSIHTNEKYLNKTTGAVNRKNYRAEKAFSVGHNDIGGAKEHDYFGYAPLLWVIKEGNKAGLKIAAPNISDFKREPEQTVEGKGIGKRQIYFPESEEMTTN